MRFESIRQVLMWIIGFLFHGAFFSWTFKELWAYGECGDGVLETLRREEGGRLSSVREGGKVVVG